MNREDLDACTNRRTCTASEHVLSCPSPRRSPAPRPPTHTEINAHTGAWLTYHHDRSGMAIFASEVEALRYAVEHSMQVTFWTFGTDWGEATDETRRPPRPPEMPPPLPDPVIPSS